LAGFLGLEAERDRGPPDQQSTIFHFLLTGVMPCRFIPKQTNVSAAEQSLRQDFDEKLPSMIEEKIQSHQAREEQLRLIAN
jgi:hypothetical protein